MTETIANVLSKIKTDLDWRGPNDKVLGTICMSRGQAEYLRAWVITLLLERDGLVFALEQTKTIVRQIDVDELRVNLMKALDP